MGRRPLCPSWLPSTLSQKPGSAIPMPLSSRIVSFAAENNRTVRKKLHLLNQLSRFPFSYKSQGVTPGEGGDKRYPAAPKPGGDDDLTLAHELVVGPAAPAPVGLLDERSELLQAQAPLLLQEEQLWRVEGGWRKAGLVASRAPGLPSQWCPHCSVTPRAPTELCLRPMLGLDDWTQGAHPRDPQESHPSQRHSEWAVQAPICQGSGPGRSPRIQVPGMKSRLRADYLTHHPSLFTDASLKPGLSLWGSPTRLPPTPCQTQVPPPTHSLGASNEDLRLPKGQLL